MARCSAAGSAWILSSCCAISDGGIHHGHRPSFYYTNYNAGMRSRLFQDDASVPARQRRVIVTSIAVVHLLLVISLRVFGNGVHGSDSENEGDGSALQVTFVRLLPTKPSTPVIPLPAQQLPIVPDPRTGLDVEAARSDHAGTKDLKVLTETGEKPSMPDGPQDQGKAINPSAVTTVSPRLRSDSASDDQLASYHAAVRAAIRRKWSERTDRPFPTGCVLRLTLATGGSVNATSATPCDIAQEDRLQLEAAALMAQPLPYGGYEEVFVPELRLKL